MRANGATIERWQNVPVNSFPSRLLCFLEKILKLFYPYINACIFVFAVHVLDNEAAVDPSHGDGV